MGALFSAAFLQERFHFPNDRAVDVVDLEGKLQLEYYELQKTFEGIITLQEEKGVYEAAKQKGAAGHDPKEPLDEIIEKINEKYKGAFTEGDRVLLTALHRKLMGNMKLANMAKTADPQIFAESIFPKAFGDAAQDSYMEAQDTYTALFEDQAKYNAIMRPWRKSFTERCGGNCKPFLLYSPRQGGGAATHSNPSKIPLKITRRILYFT